MKRAMGYLTLALFVFFSACNSADNPAGMGAGDSSISGGTGGEGSGPTGTGGSEPADNPAADSPDSNGTGTDAPN